MSNLMDAIVVEGDHCNIDLARVIAIMKNDGTYDPNKSLDDLREELQVAVKSMGLLLGGQQVTSFRFFGVKTDPTTRNQGFRNPEVS